MSNKYDKVLLKAQKKYIFATEKEESEAFLKLDEIEDMVIDDFYDELKKLGLLQGFLVAMYRMKERGSI